MLPNSVLLTLLPLLFTSVTSSPSIPPSERYHPKSRHSYSQYLSTTDGAPYLSPAQYEDAHSREIGKDTRYGFENPVLAAHYSSLSPDLAGSGLEYTGSEIDIAEKEDVSPTWLDEMAVMGHAQQAYQQQHETVAGLGDSTSAYKEKNKKPAEPFPPTPCQSLSVPPLHFETQSLFEGVVCPLFHSLVRSTIYHRWELLGNQNFCASSCESISFLKWRMRNHVYKELTYHRYALTSSSILNSFTMIYIAFAMHDYRFVNPLRRERVSQFAFWISLFFFPSTTVKPLD